VSYRIGLFIHLCALVAAVVASALAHFGSTKQARATRLTDARQWHAMVSRAELTFPIAIITLVASGAYMIYADGVWSWRTGWIIAGLTGAVLLFVLGGSIGARRKKYAVQLDNEVSAHGPDARPPALDAATETIAWMCSGLALAIICDMTIKPGLFGGMLTLAAGLVIGAIVSFRSRARHARTLDSRAASNHGQPSPRKGAEPWRIAEPSSRS